MRILLTIFFLWISGCASQSHKTMRYLAWLEGSAESEYQADKREASKRLEKFSKGMPAMDEADAFLEYISLLDAAGRSTEAQTHTHALLDHNPKETRAVFFLSVFALRKDQDSLARYYLERLEKEKDFPWKALLYNNRGMLALKDSDRSLAMSYFEKAIAQGPKTAAPLVNLGSMYLQAHHYEKSRDLFERAIDLDRDFEDAFLGLGLSLEGLAQYQKAHQAYEDFLSSHPNAMSLLYNDAILLGKFLGQKDQASSKLTRYIKLGGKETANAQKFIQIWR